MVSGFEEVSSYVAVLTYFAPTESIKAIKMQSDICQQYAKIECFWAELLHNSWWMDIDGIKHSYNKIPFNQSACNCLIERDDCWYCYIFAFSVMV